MSERVTPGPVSGCGGIREAVCVHTRKVYDSCRSRECVRDLRVYLAAASQAIIDAGEVSVKPREAELLCVCIDVEKVPYNRGFYTVDVRFFYRVTVEATAPIGMPQIIEGLAVYDKRTILFGSEGGARIFSSRYVGNSPDIQLRQRTNLPVAVVEVVDPLILEAKIVKPHHPHHCCCELHEVPTALGQAFGTDIVLGPQEKRLFITLGQFSIIRLERDIQLLMPAYDICMPEKDCSNGNSEPEDPCDLFSRFAFPVDEFFPPRMEPSKGAHHCKDPNPCGDFRPCGDQPPRSGCSGCAR